MDIKILNPGNLQDIIKYEQGMYRGYRKDPANWISRYYQKVNHNRLKPHLPYTDQILYAAIDGKNIIGAKHDCDIIRGFTLIVFVEICLEI